MRHGEAALTHLLGAARALLVTPIARRLPSWVTPHLLTALRLVLAAPLAAFLVREYWGAAFCVYALAAFTDALDGEVARLRTETSSFGARFDPSVDKVLHITVYAAFLSRAPRLLSALIALDLALFVIGLLVLLQTRPAPIAGANIYGKWKFTVQALSVAFLFLTEVHPSASLLFMLHGMLLLAIAFAVLSIVGYVFPLLPSRAR